MKHIKKFANDTDYQSFVGGGDYVTPNICLNTETMEVVCKPKPKPNYLNYIKTEGLSSYWEFQYPVNSNLTILYDTDELTRQLKYINKGEKRIIFSMGPGREIIIKTITPLEDEKYIYKFNNIN
jgi:hypothetical protein